MGYLLIVRSLLPSINHFVSFIKKAIRAQIFRGPPTSMPLVTSNFRSLFTRPGDLNSREEGISDGPLLSFSSYWGGFYDSLKNGLFRLF